MPRHTQRLRRMTSHLEGDGEDLERARMERMTDEEFEAELVEIAVQMRAWIDATPADEQAEFIARHGDPREGRRLWPKRGLGGLGAERQS